MEKKDSFFLFVCVCVCVFFFLSKSPGGHVIYRQNERVPWNGKFHLSYNSDTPPSTGWRLTLFPLPQRLYGREVVPWRYNQIFSDG